MTQNKVKANTAAWTQLRLERIAGRREDAKRYQAKAMELSGYDLEAAKRFSDYALHQIEHMHRLRMGIKG